MQRYSRGLLFRNIGVEIHVDVENAHREASSSNATTGKYLIKRDEKTTENKRALLKYITKIIKERPAGVKSFSFIPLWKHVSLFGNASVMKGLCLAKISTRWVVSNISPLLYK